jgi:hypothetical protein
VNRSLSLAAVSAISALALSGCGSLGGSSAAGQPSSSAPASAAAPSSAAGAPSSEASQAPCTTPACVTEVVEKTLPGTQAKDGSVMTRARCRQSTVRRNADGSYTVACDVTYSDESVWSGLGTYLPDSDQVSWQPQEQVG